MARRVTLDFDNGVSVQVSESHCEFKKGNKLLFTLGSHELNEIFKELHFDVVPTIAPLGIVYPKGVNTDMRDNGLDYSNRKAESSKTLPIEIKGEEVVDLSKNAKPSGRRIIVPPVEN